MSKNTQRRLHANAEEIARQQGWNKGYRDAVEDIRRLTQPKGEQVNLALMEACRKALACNLPADVKQFITDALLCAGLGSKGGPKHG